MNSTLQLDLEAARTAQQIVEDTIKPAADLENLLRRALAVLQEQGVFAAILYLHVKEKERGPIVARNLFKLLVKFVPGGTAKAPEDGRAQLKFLTDQVLTDLQTTLLVKQLWEQTLIYSRFNCKI